MGTAAPGPGTADFHNANCADFLKFVPVPENLTRSGHLICKSRHALLAVPYPKYYGVNGVLEFWPCWF